MTSVGQGDLFAFGPFGKRPLKEQVTPFKLSLLVLIHEYSLMKEKQGAAGYPGLSGMDEFSSSDTLTETEKRDFMTITLQLLQSADLGLKDLMEKVRRILKPKLYDAFCERIKEFHDEGVRPLMDFFQSLSKLLIQQEPPAEPVISRSSVLGLYIRRMVLAFEKLSFSQVTKLQAKVKLYYEAILGPPLTDDSQEFGGSLLDSGMSLSGLGRLTRSHLAKSMDGLPMGDGGTCEGDEGFYSQKQAEYFIAQQGFLLQHNENASLSPAKLQEKIANMLKANPDMVEAHFLSYLNNLRVKEYCTAVHNLYHYFDRTANIAGDTAQANKNREEDVSRRYAALNLAALHYRFGHREEALASLQEAIRMAQEKNDHVCLQHALGWLHRLGEQGSPRIANLMERSVAKSSELGLPNLTSLGVQSLARHNTFTSGKPASVFEFLLKSDILNCQHSQSGFMCISSSHKAALWQLYGKRESSSACSQLVLNLDTSESGVYHNGESVCIALCNNARQHADQGLYTAALDIVNNAKRRFPSHTQHAHIWMACEQEVLFDRTLLNTKWSIAEQAVLNLQALDEHEAEIRAAILCKEKGEVTEALSQLHKLLDKCKQKKGDYSPDFPCRVLLVLGELYVQTGNHTTAISYILETITRAKEHHLQYIVALATVHLAFIQLQMQLPQQALNLLDQQMITILSHGSVLDRARTLYCYARCQVAAASKLTDADRKSALLSAVNMMDNILELFRKVEAFHRVKDACYYQARLYNELGYSSERNKCAHQFRQLDQQYPTLHRMSVSAL